MIISIEGVDGAGKSTLANKLSEAIGYPILDMNVDMIKPQSYSSGDMKCSAPNFDRDSWKVAAVTIEALHLAGANAILDRTTLSCWAYQQRRDSNLAYLEQIIKHVRPVIVVLDTDIKTCLKRDKDLRSIGWGFEELTFQKHRMLASAECFSNSGVPVITIHQSKSSSIAICESVVKQMKEMKLL